MRAADPMRAVPDRAELDDVRDRVVALLLGEPRPGIPDPGTPFILVARDLSPAVTAGLDPKRVLAIVTERGGPTSHTAVLAKSLGIPAVVGCPGVASLRSGQQVLVDGLAGEVTAIRTAGHGRPRAGQWPSYRADPVSVRSRSRPGPGRLGDGRSVQLLAAVGGVADVAAAVAAGAEGVGVFRTEFAFLDRAEPPSVAEQADAYREVFDAFAGKPVTVRTLDIGADKPAAYLRLGDQPNPALGIRGLRVARRHPELLVDQLTAIAHATRGCSADVRVMAPMVATPAEAAWFAAQARQAGVTTTGVMVEMPAAALRAADILQVVDFVSVGSNDLAQYAFATDRADGELSDLLDPWQPAFLDLVATVLRAGSVVGRSVTVCGEAPSDPLLALVLVGLGASGLSMAPRSLAVVRQTLVRHSLPDCTRYAAAALSADGPPRPGPGSATRSSPPHQWPISRPIAPPMGHAWGGSVPGMRVTGDGGVGIEVIVDGPYDGKPVLLMHGWPDTHRLWRHQVAALTDAGYRTIAPDLRGFGASDKPTEVEAYKLTHSVVDMLAVLDALDVSSAAVIAHDWGAVAGWGLAAFAPDRVERYAALSVGHPKAFMDAGFAQRMRSLYMLLFNIPVVAEQWMSKFGDQMLASHADREAVLAEQAEPGAMTAGFGWYRANASPKTIVNPPPALPPVICPVTGIWSSNDIALTEAQMIGSEQYVDGPWRYERIEGAGHWMQLDAPDQLNRILLDFLS